MKIGLAVCYDTKNFGSQLQVLATMKELELLGHMSEIIVYRKKLTFAFALQQLPRLVNLSFITSKLRIKKKRRQLYRCPDIYKQILIRNKRFEQFAVSQFLSASRSYEGWDRLKKETEKAYDIFLCGSDQLWLPNNLESHFYTLEFAPDNKPKIAYATSFGVSQIPNCKRRGMAKFLERFQYLSTRELSGQKIIMELTGRESPVVCDPTLLFDATEWEKLIPDREIVEEPYVFGYFLGTNPKHREETNAFVRKTGMKLITCPFLNNFTDADRSFGDIQMFDMDAADFVNLIRHAEYILTDSFHGTVFSIIHHKKFMVFDRFENSSNSRNSRIESLCTLLNLNDRRFRGNVRTITDEIDYASVDSRLKNFRAQSVQYLQKALK